MDNKINNSRRNFFKQAVGVLGGLIAAPALLRTLMSSIAHAEEIKYVKPGVGLAGSVNYNDDRTKVKKELQADRAGVKFKDQKCSACMLYTKDSKGGAYGKCSLFPNETVKADAWCASWSKKV